MTEIRNGKENWKSSIQSARGHFEEGFQELAHAAEQAKIEGHEVWARAQEKARETWEEVQDRGTGALDSSRSKGQDLVKRSRRYVQASPGPAMGWTVAIGFFLGMWLLSGGGESEQSQA